MEKKRKVNFAMTAAAVCVAIAALLKIIIPVAGYYAAYVFASYYRIKDGISLEIVNNTDELMSAGKTYSALTFNIGFGAYDKDFDFFMDSGFDVNGNLIYGSHSRAQSGEKVLENIRGAENVILSLSPDIVFLQEVDTSAHRSCFVDQLEIFTSSFEDYGSVFAQNAHTPYFLYPLNEPIGMFESGLLSLYRMYAGSSVRLSLPLSDSVMDNLFDLDRCMSVTRFPVEGSDKQFVAVNVHMSAYDIDGKVRDMQIKYLGNFLSEERRKGNYVLAGGDFKNILAGSFSYFTPENGETVPPWAGVWNASFPGFDLIATITGDGPQKGTCRNNTRPYDEDWTYTCVIDGFIVSDNIKILNVINITSHDFAFSDHNPVKTEFVLL